MKRKIEAGDRKHMIGGSRSFVFRERTKKKKNNSLSFNRIPMMLLDI